MINNLQEKKCFTIGYGDYPIELFLYFLERAGINTIIDVRSSPYSKYNFAYNRDNLEKFLIKHLIDYWYLGDKIGGRYSNPNLLYPDGTVNYQKVQNTEQFREGIDQVLSTIIKGRKIALMCAEKEPEKCHRFALISRFLQSKGIKVIHIRPEIRLQSNEDLEKELIKLFCDNNQETISNEPINSKDIMYEKLNRKIAYKSKEYNPQSDFHLVKENNELISPEPVVPKNDDLINRSYVCEPIYSNTEKVGISQRADSFSDVRKKKEIQKSLF